MPQATKDRRSSGLVKTKTPGIYRKGNRYQVRTTVHGRMVIKSFRTAAEAKRYKGQLAEGRKPTSSKPFRAYADEWLASYNGRRAGGISQTTRAAYKDALDRFAKPFFAAEPLDEIGPKRIQEYLDHLNAKGLTPNSIRKYYAATKALFATAVVHELIRENPTREITVAYADARPRTTKWMTPAQTGQLLAAIPEDHVDLVFTLATTGLRISEALGLRWQDIGRHEGKPSLSVTKSKTRAGERTIYLTPETVRRLTKRQAESDYNDPTDYVFPTKTGTMIDARNWRRRVFSPAAKVAGVPSATPHRLRHGVASLMAAQGIGEAQIAATLGHADGGILALKTYIHVEPTVVDFIDGALKPEAKRKPAAVRA